jgi:hypothetical protein
MEGFLNPIDARCHPRRNGGKIQVQLKYWTGNNSIHQPDNAMLLRARNETRE